MCKKGECHCKARKDYAKKNLEDALNILTTINYHSIDDYTQGQHAILNIQKALNAITAE